MNPSMLARTIATMAVVATGACAQVVEPSPGAAPISELREASGLVALARAVAARVGAAGP